VKKALERAKPADLIIVSMYGRVRTGQSNSGALPEPGARALAKLIERKAPLVGISFGNPYLLMNFPELKTYLVAYGDMPSLQRAAARALLGEIDVVGRLPISLPQLYARGTGIQLKALGTHVGGNQETVVVILNAAASQMHLPTGYRAPSVFLVWVKGTNPKIGEILEAVKNSKLVIIPDEYKPHLYLSLPSLGEPEALDNTKTVSDYKLKNAVSLALVLSGK
jgi:hypothetical protein